VIGPIVRSVCVVRSGVLWDRIPAPIEPT